MIANGGDRTRTRIERVALAVVLAVGALLLVFPLATNMFSKASSTEDLLGAMRPYFTDQALAQARTDVTTMQAMGTEMQQKTLPALASQLHMTPQQMDAFMQSSFPAVAKGTSQMGTILTYFSNSQQLMSDQQSNFHQADAILTENIASTAVPLLFVVCGVGLLAVGAAGLLRARLGRAMLATASGLGVVMVAGLLATSLAGKANAGDTMNAAMKPVFSTQGLQTTRQYTETFSAMATELTQKTVPMLATTLGVPKDQLVATLSATYPAVGKGIAQLPAVVQRTQSLATTVEANAGNFDQSVSIPWSPGSLITVFWFMMVPALFVIVLGLGAVGMTLLGGRRVGGPVPAGLPH